MTEPAPPTSFSLSLSTPAQHVAVAPGGEIVLKGAFRSSHDGSVVDAASTTWPQGAPGGASVDAGGLVDLQKGGFHITSRDPVTHEVHAVYDTSTPSACALYGTSAPCLPLRLREPAQKRLITDGDWARSLKGGITVEVINPPAYAPAVSAGKQAAPYLAGAAALLAAGLGVAAALRWRRRKAESPQAQLLALARKVQQHARGADPALAAPLAGPLAGAIERLEKGAIDPASPEGRRVRVMLEKVDQKLTDKAQQARSQREREVADELAREVEDAFEAAEEALQAERR